MPQSVRPSSAKACCRRQPAEVSAPRDCGTWIGYGHRFVWHWEGHPPLADSGMGLQYTERMGKYDRGVLVFAEVAQGALTTLAREMLGAGHRLADVLGEPLLAAVRGHGIAEAAQEAVFHAADTVEFIPIKPLAAKV